jgi:hypothetical protein
MAESLEAGARSGRRETLADLYVVDADVHVHEDPAELAEYAEPPWDVALREIAKVEERYLDLPAMSPSSGSRGRAARTGRRSSRRRARCGASSTTST